MNIDLSRTRLTPYSHQLVGIDKIVEWDNPAEGRIYGGCFFLADEMGAGKTKQTIDAACVLADRGLIDHVVIIAPSAVRAVWFDPELGELSKHMWPHLPSSISEYHAKTRSWPWFLEVEGKKFKSQLRWTITNYDFIRNKDRMKTLLKECNDNTLLVLDESAAVKGWKSIQTKACEEIRSRCGRVLLLNGTPIANGPGDLYSQARIMDPRILGCESWFHFRARYAILGGWQNKQIVKWRDLDDLAARLAPYTLRRLKSQCLDLPPKIDSVSVTVPLTPATWKIYKEMKDDMVAWLSDTSLTAASQAIVKVVRLAQITSGFVGGVEVQEAELSDRPDFIEEEFPEEAKLSNIRLAATQEVGREKLDAFVNWLEDQLAADQNIKILAWCRFRPEVQRLFDELAVKFPQIQCGMIWGGQKRDSRDHALRLLDPRTMPKGPVVVIGTPATGSMGLNLTGAHTVIYVSNDFSLKTRLQSEDRVHRPGQTYPVSYYDMIATGPQGQKTIDHTVVKALKNKEDLANLTTASWLSELSDNE